MREPTTRREKIKLLNELKSGKISIYDLTSQTNLWFMENKKLKNNRTGELLSREDIDKKYPKSMNLIFTPATGCDPIIT